MSKTNPIVKARATKAAKATAVPNARTKPQIKKRPATRANATKRLSNEVPPPCKEPRKGIPLDLKVQFLQDVETERKRDPKIPLSSIGRWPKYNFNRKEASRTFNDAAKIRLKVQEMGLQNSRKITKIYPRKLEVIEKVLLITFQEETANNVLVNDSRLKELACQIYMEMAPLLDPSVLPAEFGFSDGWLQNFKRNNNIRMHTAHDETGDVDVAKHGPLFEEIANQLSKFEPADIYNCGETGLYLKVPPKRTLSQKAVLGRKVTRDARVSILLCCNADGTDKRKLFVMSAHRPKGLHPETEARIKTDFKGSGYMTQALFKDWLEEFDTAMEGRSILLLMGNAPGHSNTDKFDLKNITLIRLPPNTTSVTQPLDAGIIRSFKVKYSRHMIRVASKYRSGADSNAARIPNAELWPCLVAAWHDVTQSKIRNSFVHIPTIQERLQMPVMDVRGDEMEQLKKDLMMMYPDRADAIERQKDFGVLTYLKCCEGKGPTKQLTAAINSIAAIEKFKRFFLPAGSVVLVGDAQEDDADDSSDPDYSPENSNVERSKITASKRSMKRRSDQHEMERP